MLYNAAVSPKRKLRKKARVGAPDVRSVSIHKNVSEELPAFLKKESLGNKEIEEAVASLVNLLSNYREEGHRLYPEVFIFEDVQNILKTLPNSERVIIGHGSKGSSTLAAALKRCAPLAQWGWSVYILSGSDKFEYGLLRCGLTALSLTTPELLIDHGDESLPAILIRHVSQHTIEISGACRNSLRIHFGPVEQSGDDPLLVTKRFCASVVTQVAAEFQEQVRDFYWRVFRNVLRSGHGCLAVVVKASKRKLPPQFRDGVLLEPPINIAARVANLLKSNSCESDTSLRATAALIKGMLSTDGITVFYPDASIWAYNVFVRSPDPAFGGAGAFGGARKRAYRSLCSWVGRDLSSAYFLSQDGHAEFRGSK